MSVLKRTATVVLTSLIATYGGVSAAVGAPVPEVKVVSLGLTDRGGSLTPVAKAGIEELEAQAQKASAGVGTQVPRLAPLKIKEVVDNTAVLTEDIETDSLSAIGFTWTRGERLDPSNQFYVRVFEPGYGWTNWLQLAEERDEKTAPVGGTDGTSPLVMGEATAVQARITGNRETLPSNLRFVLHPTEQTPRTKTEVVTKKTTDVAKKPAAKPVPEPAPVTEATTPVTVKPAAYTQVEAAAKPTAAQVVSLVKQTAAALWSASEAGVQPGAIQPAAGLATAPATKAMVPGSVIKRAAWGAGGSPDWKIRYYSMKGAIIHHTVSTNNYTPAQSYGIVRGIYNYHTHTRNWGDIGYNFLVDKYGQIFEGRNASLTSPFGEIVEAGHAAPHNKHFMGVSAIGDYTRMKATPALLAGISDVIAWKLSETSIGPWGKSGVKNSGISSIRPKGYDIDAISGHRDVRQTACPGAVYENLPAIRSLVHKKIPGYKAKHAKVTKFYFSNKFGGYAQSVQSFPRLGEPVAGDWNGDGKDTSGIRRGRYFELSETIKNGSPIKWISYGDPGDLLHIGDWDGDGVDTLMVQRRNLYYIKNTVTTGVADKVIMYGNPGDVSLVGDFNGDGKDTLVVRRGRTFHVRNSMTTGKEDYRFDYGDPGDVVLVGDWDGDGKDSLMVRRGSEYHVRNAHTSGKAEKIFYYGNPGDEVVVGDWDGDGKDTIAVVRRGR